MRVIRLACWLTVCLAAATVQADMSIALSRRLCAEPGVDLRVPLSIENADGGHSLGGFDFLISYDSVLDLRHVAPGQILTDCGWEYFTHMSTGYHKHRFVSIAETINGPHHPSCFGDVDGVLVELKFQADSLGLESGEWLPVSFLWEDCGDNSLSSNGGDSQFVSLRVYDFDGTDETEITSDNGFPTQGGAPSECVQGGPGSSAVRAVDFHNGGLLITALDT